MDGTQHQKDIPVALFYFIITTGVNNKQK